MSLTVSQSASKRRNPSQTPKAISVCHVHERPIPPSQPPTNSKQPTPASNMTTTQDLRPGTSAIVLSPGGHGISEPATAMAYILELTDPRTGGGHHSPTHYVPAPEPYFLVRHWRNSTVVTESVRAAHVRVPKFRIGQTVFVDHNLDFGRESKRRFRDHAVTVGLNGPFEIVGIAYPEGSVEDVAAQAEYLVQIGTGDGTARRWWRERWLRGSSRKEDDGAAAVEEGWCRRQDRRHGGMGLVSEHCGAGEE